MSMVSTAVSPSRPLLVLSAALLLLLAGCGTPSAPLPPSLNLPEKVGDLAASRAGATVTLTWTMPRRTTDKLLLKEPISVHICRQLGDGPCQPAGPGLMLPPATAQTFTDPLPAPLLNGQPRALRYFVELRNRAGRTAGPASPAVVLAGAAPAPVQELKAELRKAGIVLLWQPSAAPETIRLHRTLLDAAPKSAQGPMAAPAEPTEQTLLVEPGPQPGRALDRSIRFGHRYQYRAQRIARVTVDGKSFELGGELTPPLRVDAADIFPPPVPSGLAAVATSSEGATPAIDLSWQPLDDPDLAGYAVYRRDGAAGWQRISAAEQVTGPSFRDSRVEPGHTYAYAVRSIARNGHESQLSTETEETVPTR